MSKSSPILPPSVTRALRRLGRDINDARRRRRIPEVTLAERSFMARGTLRRVLAGDPGASMGAYASVLFALGLADKLETLAAAAGDVVGLQLEEEHLPKRVRHPRPLGSSRRRPRAKP